MFEPIRKLAGAILRNAGWERKYLFNPFIIHNALGHKVFPAELGVIYKQYDNRTLSEYKYGDLACLSQIGEGQTVVDVGANIGFYTLLLARQVGPAGKVFSFEPGPISFALLRANCELNGYRNITLINSAVSNKTGKTKFFLSRSGESDNKMHNPSDESRDEVEVDVKSLDEYFGDMKIDFIKMDIQGSEYFALQGMNAVISANPNLKMLMEFSPNCLESAGVDLVKFLRYIRSLGFRISILYDDKPTEEISDEKLLGMVGKGKKYRYVDVLLQR